MKTKQITIGAVLIAINIVLSYVAKLPTPTGFVSLVETGIFIGAWHFGPKMGLAVGGLTGFLLDLFAGYPQWMLFSLLIHGGEGWVIGHYNVDKTVGIRVLGNIITGRNVGWPDRCASKYFPGFGRIYLSAYCKRTITKVDTLI